VLGRCQHVGAQRFDRRSGKHPPALALALSEQHAREVLKVIDAADEATSARGETRRLGPARRVGAVAHEQSAAISFGCVQHGQTRTLLGRDGEARIAHAERLEDALGQHGLERLTGNAREQHPQDIGRRVVEPLRAGLIGQRHFSEPLHPSVGIERGGIGHPLRLRQRRCGQGEQAGPQRRRTPTETHLKTQHVMQRDRARRAVHVAGRAVRIAHHVALAELRQPRIDRIVEAQPARFDE
jgi:hypothetical protein